MGGEGGLPAGEDPTHAAGGLWHIHTWLRGIQRQIYALDRPMSIIVEILK